MDENRLPKKMLIYKPEGRRNIGRPQTRWGDDFREEGIAQGAYDDDEILIVYVFTQPSVF